MRVCRKHAATPSPCSLLFLFVLISIWNWWKKKKLIKNYNFNSLAEWFIKTIRDRTSFSAKNLLMSVYNLCSTCLALQTFWNNLNLHLIQSKSCAKALCLRWWWRRSLIFILAWVTQELATGTDIQPRAHGPFLEKNNNKYIRKKCNESYQTKAQTRLTF